ncbi:MAG: tetratricopeptide repeat protein [Salinibacter sp.]
MELLWRGDLYRDLGKLEKAERWYRAAWTLPEVHQRLGQLYEKMGEPEKAKAAYRRFIEAWENADPELQGRVEKARRRLEALREKQATE